MDINYNNLKSDYEGLYSLSHKEDAEYVSLLIKEKYGNIKILDGTAGIGGNSISFGHYFTNVISIEKNIERYNYLVENLNSFNLKNKVINGSLLDYLNEDYDLIFIDPPWGGPNYKYEKELSLSIDNITLKKIVSTLKESNKIIILKLPFNYNLNDFSLFNYQIYKIKNYQLIVIN